MTHAINGVTVTDEEYDLILDALLLIKEIAKTEAKAEIEDLLGTLMYEDDSVRSERHAARRAQ